MPAYCRTCEEERGFVVTVAGTDHCPVCSPAQRRAEKTERVRNILVLISTLSLNEMRALKEAMLRQWFDDEGGSGVREPSLPRSPRDQAGAEDPVPLKEEASP